MLRYFRINDPYRLLGLLVLLVILYTPLLVQPHPMTATELHSLVVGRKVGEGFRMYVQVVDNTAPLAALTFGFFSHLFGGALVARRILGLLILFLESAFLGAMFIRRKAYAENTFLPSLLFSLVGFFSFDMMTFSGTLVASVFALLTLNNLLREIESGPQRDENIFNMGVLLSIATLFDFSFVLFMPGCIVLLVFFTRLGLRKHLLFVFGFLLPHLLLWSFYFLQGNQGALWRYAYTSQLHWFLASAYSFRGFLWMGAPVLCYLLLSIFVLNREARTTKYQSQLLQVMFLWMGIALAQVFMEPGITPQSFVTLLPSVSFFLSYFFLLIRRRRVAEVHLWVLFFSVAALGYLVRFGRIDAAPPRALLAEAPPDPLSGQRVLVLENAPGWYRLNAPATGFINWRFAREFFEDPGDPGHLAIVAQQMEEDPPQVIVDPQGLMAPMFGHMPAIAREYVRRGDRYERNVNN